jgi:hypothetical protein
MIFLESERAAAGLCFYWLCWLFWISSGPLVERDRLGSSLALPVLQRPWLTCAFWQSKDGQECPSYKIIRVDEGCSSARHSDNIRGQQLRFQGGVEIRHDACDRRSTRRLSSPQAGPDRPCAGRAQVWKLQGTKPQNDECLRHRRTADAAKCDIDLMAFSVRVMSVIFA